MSEHHRGAWDTRGDAVWWPGSLATQDQQTLHHQHLINQHHQQQLAAQQQQQQQQAAQQQQQQLQQQQQQQQAAQQQQQHQVVVQQQQNQQQQSQQSHNDVARSNCTTSGVTTQQLFSYKMASSFQNPATTMAQVVATSNAGTVSGYDYRLNMATAQAAAPGTQWWYAAAANSQMDANTLQQHQQQQNQQQNVHNVNTPPSSVLNNVGSSDSGGVSNTFEQLYSTYLFNMLANQHLADQIQQQQQNHQNNQPQQQIQLQKQQHSTMIRGKVDAKPRGRMTAYAFFVQTCREEHKKKHPEETVIFAEFSRKCAERWKTMLDKEKKRFHEMAEKDKARYDREMSNYVPPKGVIIGRGKKRKQNKDPNAPKRSLSAFFWFCNDERNKVKALNPEYGVGDIAKELGRKWSDVDAETKQKYELMAEKDKARYEREMTEYKQKGKIPLSAPSMQQQVQQQQQQAQQQAQAQQLIAQAAQQQAQQQQQQQQQVDADVDDDEDGEDEENH